MKRDQDDELGVNVLCTLFKALNEAKLHEKIQVSSHGRNVVFRLISLGFIC